MTWQQASYDSTFSADDFVFADGRRMDLLLAYGTLGVSAPDKGNAVLLLHDTVGGGQQLLQPAFCRRDVRRGRNAGSVRACGGNLADGDGVGGGGHRIGWPTRIGAGAVDGAAHLEGVLAAAAPQRDFQAVDRSAVRRQGGRHRRALSQSAGSRRDALRRGELSREADRSGAGARPHPADPAAAPRPGRAAHSRLQAAGHDVAVRRTRHQGWNHRRQVHGAPPRRRVSALPRYDREECPGRPRCACRDGQRIEPQDQADPELACSAPALAGALHTDLGIMDRSGRALLRAADRRSDQAGTHRSVRELETAISTSVNARNAGPKPRIETLRPGH